MPPAESRFRRVRRSHGHLLLVACLLLGALFVRLPGITEPSIAQRETQSALRARSWSIDRSQLPEWKLQVLEEMADAVRPIEPPLLDLVVASHYRLSGENFWFPRFLSSLAWILGGPFLYLIGRRLTTRTGSVVALALYLVWPFATSISRLFMPDALMVAALLAAAWTVTRYWEAPSMRRLVAAGGASAFATAVKPGVAFLCLAGLFLALAVAKGQLRESFVRGRVPLFLALSLSVAGAYYVWGTYLSDFVWTEADRGRLTPDHALTGQFWSDWWNAVSHVLRYPQSQSLLALGPLLAGIAGLVLAPRGAPRAILVGLLAGYVVFGLTFARYVSTNPYYSLPLVAILALAIGVVTGRLLDSRRVSPPALRASLVALIAVVVVAGAYKSYAVVNVTTPRDTIADYRRIGEVTNHTTRAIVVDRELSTPAMYWGWIVGRAWELEYAAPPSWINPEDADYLVVVGLDQLAASPGLTRFVRGRPVVAETERFAVFDLRDGNRTSS